MKPIYLDHNATTALHPRAARLLETLGQADFGNPSSLHWAGVGAQEHVRQARRQVATLVGAGPSEIVFTGGGTEADVTALRSMVWSARQADPSRPARIAVCVAEHPAITRSLAQMEGFGVAEMISLGLHPDGSLRLEELDAALEKGLDGLCVMFAHNETGALFDLDAIGERLKGRDIPWHCDAVQALGKVSLDLPQMGQGQITSAAMAAHKLYGPKGVGALWLRRGQDLLPLLPGSQEKGRRAGTLNVPGIAAFGCVAEIAAERLEGGTPVRAMRDYLERGLREVFSTCVVHAEAIDRLPNTCFASLGHPGGWIDAEAAMLALSRAQIAVSTGSACHAGDRRVNRTLDAMGVSPEAGAAALRFSLGAGNEEIEIDQCLQALRVWLKARVRG